MRSSLFRPPSSAPPRLLVLLGSLLLAACGGGGAQTETGSTFRVLTSTPSDGATGVSRTSSVSVRFSQALDVATVGPQALTLTAQSLGAIAGNVVVDPTGETLHFLPSMLLPADTHHTCRVHAELRSETGAALGGDLQIDFRTAFEDDPVGLPDPNLLRRTADDLSEGRQSHRATLLNDGRVLITGGFSQGSAVTDEAEIYQPSLESFFTLTSSMVQARAGHSATLLTDGRVLLAGGWANTAGGTEIIASAEIFDPLANTFSDVGSMGSARVDHAAVLLPDGRVLLTGGSGPGAGTPIDLDTAEVFDPSTEAFDPLPETMTSARATHTAFLVGGAQVVLLGGSLTTTAADVLNLSTLAFEATNHPAGESARFGAAGATFDSGAICVAGGDNAGGVLHVFPDPLFLQNTGSALMRPRAYATATRLGADRILVAGGIDFSRGGFLEASCDLVVEGGLGGSRTYATEVRFSHGMAGHTATLLPSGDILFCGGLSADGTAPNHAEAFLYEAP